MVLHRRNQEEQRASRRVQARADSYRRTVGERANAYVGAFGEQVHQIVEATYGDLDALAARHAPAHEATSRVRLFGTALRRALRPVQFALAGAAQAWDVELFQRLGKLFDEVEAQLGKGMRDYAHAATVAERRAIVARIAVAAQHHGVAVLSLALDWDPARLEEVQSHTQLRHGRTQNTIISTTHHSDTDHGIRSFA